MNRIQKGAIGLYYLLRHPMASLRLGWLQKEYRAGETSINNDAFRREYSDICIPFEVFWEQQQLNPSIITFHSTKTLVWSLSQYETFVLCQLVKSINPEIVFEIGTSKGQTTRNIEANLPDGGSICTLDLQQGLIGTGKIIPFSGDSMSFDFSPYYEKIGLMFVDGSHEYNYVLYDSENALKCVKKGGFIAWHDFIYDRPDTVKAILDFCHQHNLKPFWIDGTSLAICRIGEKSDVL